MKKNYKKIYGYALVMIVCVLVIVLIACLSENRLEGYQSEYEQTITGNQKQIETLEAEVARLSNENAELQKQLDKAMTLGADLVTSQQAMSDMKDIFETYKSGDVKSAKDAYRKIEPIGFDDSTLAYFELLGELLNK